MRAVLVGLALVGSLLVFAPTGSAHDEECSSIFNCNIENAPPNCVGGWYGTWHYHVGGFSFTIHYCAYEGPPY